MELPLCLRIVGMKVEAHPSVSVVLGWVFFVLFFFNLLDLVYFVNVVVYIFNCVFPLMEVLLEMPA